MPRKKRKAVLGRKIPRVEERKYKRQRESSKESEVRMDL
jgi:hypothetical protein